MIINTERRPDESDKQYVKRLKKNLLGLFEKQIDDETNSGLQIPMESNSAMELRAQEQWNARHEILKIIQQFDNREYEEILPNDFPKRCLYDMYKARELRQRWFTNEGKLFLKNLLTQLRNSANQHGINFTSIAATKDRMFCDFFYVHEKKETRHRDMRYVILKSVDLRGTDLELVDFLGAICTNGKFQQAILHNANLCQSIFSHSSFQNTNLCKANISNAQLDNTQLQGADLTKAFLARTNLSNANLAGADLTAAKLQGANLYKAILRKAAIISTEDGTIKNKIQEQIANFRAARYSIEWRGPKFIIPCIASLLRRKLSWRKWSKDRGKRFESNQGAMPTKFWAGRPTTFFEVNTSGMDWSTNPRLKRDIQDEQFIEAFREQNHFFYWLWAWSSNCGRCLSLWALWSLIIVSIFGAIYAHHIPYPNWMPQDGFMEDFMCPRMAIDDARDATSASDKESKDETFFTPYYYSIITFSTLGFGDIKPKNLSAEILLTVEVILGYFFLGGLISILASKLARRS